jgi:NAD(P)-dependent dehydrogenase (short-subunit alcohol dehydrogenase family)
VLLPNKRCLITGAGQGIGRATAGLFAQEGARVAVVDINPTTGQATAEEIRCQGREALFVQADVSCSADVAAAFAALDQAWGGIDVLVNNAATWTGDGGILHVSEQDWDHIQAVTLKGVFLCSREAVRRMRPAGGGSIVNIASVNGLMGCAMAAYTAAKGGVIALTRLIAAEHGREGIRCNCICPGTITTEGTRATWQREDPRETLLPLYPLGRYGLPDEIARCALFLASDQSSLVTGAVLVADGGLTANVAVPWRARP